MCAILRRMRLPVHLLHPEDTLTVLDSGLRGILGMQADYDTAYRIARQWSHPRTIYKVLDQFMCNYIYFHLPVSSEPVSVVIGPYLTLDPSHEMLLEQSERLVRTHSGARYSAAIQKAVAYIDANLSGELSLHSLARLLRLSPGYLSALFHRETGHTLAQHITEHRMKAALQLLTTTRLQVQTIAQLCGFADPNYFSKTFRRFYGVTPLQYRRDNPPSA